MTKFTYLLQEREHMRATNDGSAWTFDLWIVGDYDHEEPSLHAVIDWQDGLSIFQCEQIEPNEWAAISEQISLALKEARQKMGSNAIWNL